VNQLDGGRRRIDGIRIGAGQLATRIRKQRPHALSAIEHRVAHCATQRFGM
jgi:hypothetical protein